MREGDPTATIEPEQLAIIVATLNEGLAARAADGISRTRLHEVIDTVLAAPFPDEASPGAGPEPASRNQSAARRRT